MSSVRHRWMAARVAEVFGVTADDVSAAFQARDAAPDIDRLLDGTGPSSLFVFYQPRDVRLPVRLRIRRVLSPPLFQNLAALHCAVLQDGSVVDGTGAPQLIVTHGTTIKLRGRAVWFLRNAEIGEVDLTKVRCAR